MGGWTEWLGGILNTSIKMLHHHPRLMIYAVRSSTYWSVLNDDVCNDRDVIERPCM